MKPTKREESELAPQLPNVKDQDISPIASFSSLAALSAVGFSNYCQVKMEDGCSVLEEDAEGEHYFLSFFSPKETAESIQRKNENMEMISFQNSNEEPDDVYNRRKKKVSDLLCKEEQLLGSIREVRQEDYGKYLAIIQFISFFCQIKNQMQGIRTDYYSNKTFMAIKNASEEELHQATRVLRRMLHNIMAYPKIYPSSEEALSKNANFDERLLEFLIIPRFLISREKINKLNKDEELQSNFEFLVLHQCLGHYNNEANKKLPEERQMQYIRSILKKPDGRERFKRICSINHGSKFLIKYPQDYFELYNKNMDYLKYLDYNFKKGKKYELIKKDLLKNPMRTTEETQGNSATELSDSSESGGSFKSLEKAFNQMKMDEQESIRQQLCDKLDWRSSSQKIPQMRKLEVRKMLSVPIKEEEPPMRRGFKVKKHVSDQLRTTNIILIPPPSGL